MGPREDEERDHSAIFETFAEYKQHLLHREESATVRNGTYLLKEGDLYKMIKNHWGEDIEVAVPTSRTQAEGEVEKVHQDLGHLGTRATLAVIKN